MDKLHKSYKEKWYSDPLSTLNEFLNVSRETLGALIDYHELLKKWNQTLNLVSRNDLDNIWYRHILDSAQLAQYIEDKGEVVVDLGSGGGLPAIVLGILLPSKIIHMVESDKRKVAFLKEASTLCSAQMVVHNQRIEKLDGWQADIITARALASLDKLLEYSLPFIGEKTNCFFFKGERADAEIQEAYVHYDFEHQKFPSVTAPRSWIVSVKHARMKQA